MAPTDNELLLRFRADAAELLSAVEASRSALQTLAEIAARALQAAGDSDASEVVELRSIVERAAEAYSVLDARARDALAGVAEQGGDATAETQRLTQAADDVAAALTRAGSGLDLGQAADRATQALAGVDQAVAEINTRLGQVGNIEDLLGDPTELSAQLRQAAVEAEAVAEGLASVTAPDLSGIDEVAEGLERVREQAEALGDVPVGVALETGEADTDIKGLVQSLELVTTALSGIRRVNSVADLGDDATLSERTIGSLRSTVAALESTLKAIPAAPLRQVGAEASGLAPILGEVERELAVVEQRLVAAGAVTLKRARTGLEDVGEQAEQAGERLDRAGSDAQTLEDRLRQAATAARNLGTSASDAGRKSSDGLGQVPPAVERISRETRLAERLMGGLTERTRQAATQGIESGVRIERAFEAAAKALRELGDDAQIAEVVLAELGESPAENLRDWSSESERQLVLLAQLQKAVIRLGEESGEGIGSFADNAAKSRLAISELEELIQQQGQETLPGVRRELRRLQGAYDQTFEVGQQRVVKLETELERVELQTRQMQTAVQGGILSVDDQIRLLLQRFPRLAKAFAVVGSSAATLATSYQGTRAILEGVNEELGINIERAIGAEAVSVKLANVWARLTGLAQTQAEEEAELANQRALLIRRGEEFTDTVDGIREAYERMGREFQRQRFLQADAFSFLDDLRSFSASSFDTEARRILELVPRIKEQLKTDPQALEPLKEQLTTLILQAERLGTSVDQEVAVGIRKLAKELGIANPLLADLRLNLEELGIVGVEQIGAIVKQVLNLDGEFRSTVGGVEVLTGVTRDNADLMVASIDRILEQIRSLPPTQREAAADWVASLERVRAGYVTLTTEAGEALDELRARQQEAFEGLSQTIVETVRTAREQLQALRQESQGPDAGDGGQSVEQLTQRLAELRAEQEQISGQPIITAEQSERLETLRQQISDTAGQLRELPSPPADLFEAAVTGGDILRDTIRSLVTDNEAFAAGYEALGDTARRELREILSLYDQQASVIGANEQTLAALGTEIERVFDRAGVPVQGLRDTLAEFRGETVEVGELLERLETGAAQSKFRALEKSSKDLIGEWKTIPPTGAAVVRSLADVERATGQADVEVASLQGNFARLGNEVFDLGAEVSNLGGQVEGVAVQLETAGDGAQAVATGAAAMAVDVPRATRALGDATQPAIDAGVALGDLVDQLEAVNRVEPVALREWVELMFQLRNESELTLARIKEVLISVGKLADTEV